MRCKYFLLSLAIFLPAFAWAQERQQAISKDNPDIKALLQTSHRQEQFISDARSLLKTSKNTTKSTSFSERKIIVFVSFSMPLQSIKQWLLQTQQQGGSLVLRGLVHQSFRETAMRVGEVLDGKQGGVQIDPNLFKKFHVASVPAVVQVNQDETYDIVYGDIGLAEAIRRLNEGY